MHQRISSSRGIIEIVVNEYRARLSQDYKRMDEGIDSAVKGIFKTVVGGMLIFSGTVTLLVSAHYFCATLCIISGLVLVVIGAIESFFGGPWLFEGICQLAFAPLLAIPLNAHQQNFNY